jgi:hypothetical protein
LEFEKLKKVREDVAAQQAQVEAKEQALRMKVRLSMEQHVKETAPDRGKEQNERRMINEFLQNDEVQTIFYRFEQSLRHMYKFYASQDKKDLSFNLERSMNTMTMREFVRFCFQQLIIPSLL